MTQNDLKYYPIRLEKSVSNIEYVSHQLNTINNIENKFNSLDEGTSFIKKEFQIGDTEKEKKIIWSRLSSIENYTDFKNSGRNIFDFSAPLLEMLQITDVKEIKFSDIKFPYNFFYVSLIDLGLVLNDNYHGHTCYLDGVFVERREYDGEDIVKYGLSFDFCGYTKEITDKGKEFKNVFPDAIFLSKTLEFKNANSSIEDALNLAKDLMGDEENETLLNSALEEYKLLLDYLKLTINALLYLSLPNPDIELADNSVITESNNLLTPSRLIEKSKNNSKSYNKIRYVGHKERKDTSTPTGKKLKTHWRRGHWRNQPYGGRLESKKLIWIKPIIIGNGLPDKGKIYEP